MYYSLVNSSLPYVLCYMLYVVYCVYIYIYICCICECGTRPERSTLCGEWYWNEKSSRSYEPPSPPLSLSTATCTAHTATAKLQ